MRLARGHVTTRAVLFAASGRHVIRKKNPPPSQPHGRLDVALLCFAFYQFPNCTTAALLGSRTPNLTTTQVQCLCVYTREGNRIEFLNKVIKFEIRFKLKHSWRVCP